jgi:hypothetical protein
MYAFILALSAKLLKYCAFCSNLLLSSQQVAANTRKSHNKNHYQAMLDDTSNVYFYRIRSRDAAGRLTGHIVVVLVTNGITIINIINLTGGT